MNSNSARILKKLREMKRTDACFEGEVQGLQAQGDASNLEDVTFHLFVETDFDYNVETVIEMPEMWDMDSRLPILFEYFDIEPEYCNRLSHSDYRFTVPVVFDYDMGDYKVDFNRILDEIYEE